MSTTNPQSAIRNPQSTVNPYQYELPMSRRRDPFTSKLAGEHVRERSETYQARLLRAYQSHPEGLTDEEAGKIADLSHTGYWKRCSDLRRAGLIIITSETRLSSSGEHQRVCKINPHSAFRNPQSTLDTTP